MNPTHTILQYLTRSTPLVDRHYDLVEKLAGVNEQLEQLAHELTDRLGDLVELSDGRIVITGGTAEWICLHPRELNAAGKPYTRHLPSPCGRPVWYMTVIRPHDRYDDDEPTGCLGPPSPFVWLSPAIEQLVIQARCVEHADSAPSELPHHWTVVYDPDEIGGIPNPITARRSPRPNSSTTEATP